MEDMLTLYEEPYDPLRPIICFDERPCQLIGDVLAPIPMKPGRSTRPDDDDKRHGTCCVFLAFDPGRHWRFVQVRARRTAVDYALFMKQLVEPYDALISRIRLVQDNLTTPTPGSLDSAFPPQEAFAFAQKFELHEPPSRAVG